VAVVGGLTVRGALAPSSTRKARLKPGLRMGFAVSDRLR